MKHQKLSRELAEKSLQILNAAGEEGMAEPFKSLFTQFKSFCTEAISKLPGADDPMWNGEYLSSLLNSLSNAVSLITTLNAQCKRLEEEMTGTKNSLPSEVEKLLTEKLGPAVEQAIKAKVEAGELVEKATVNSLCEAAKAQGVEAGKAELAAAQEAARVEAELKASRTEEVTKQSLPLPPAAVLVLGDEEWKKSLTQAQERASKLTAAGLPAENPEMARVWQSEADFAVLENLMKLPALRVSKQEPLAGAAATSAVSGRRLPV